MKKLIIVFFALMCLAQWFVPGQMIYDQEKVISEGKIFKFKTAPVDPSDPFRGKYVTLNFEANSIGIVNPDEWQNAEDVYVSIEESGGFARISTVSMYEPEGTDYIKAKIDEVTDYTPYTLRVDYPFERFYVEESKAAEAERLYWRSKRGSTDTSTFDSTRVTYALVSVKKGKATLLDVMINDRSITDIVREINETPK